MKIKKSHYVKYATAHAPKSCFGRGAMRAFLVGGLICAVGEGLTSLWCSLGTERSEASLITSLCLILLSTILTCLGVFDDIAKVGGAGTLLPITGFANAVVSSALDSKNEGLVLGLGSGIFSVAGPVLLYGTASGAIYGLIYWLVGK